MKGRRALVELCRHRRRRRADITKSYRTVLTDTNGAKFTYSYIIIRFANQKPLRSYWQMRDVLSRCGPGGGGVGAGLLAH
ncbi:hypothetical protein JYU34_007199 [Plutella xylostella]|uniref:Uncharacterized protein n=1 Tax=Plutella xylostella TaxID=51655 RepID=A0ABQ7QPT9_PLUXY|nr:hypothetical protein JYU34_007199 [Plutella xylostella]